MDHFRRLTSTIRNYLILMLSLQLLLIGGFFWLALALTDHLLLASAVGLATGLISIVAVAWIATSFALKPLAAVWQAVLHVSSASTTAAAPNIEKLHTGRELVNTLVLQIYQFASQRDGTDLIEHRKELSQAANIVSHMPLPLFVFNKEQLVTNASTAALEYCRVESSQLFGKPLFDSLKLEFTSDNTLEAWILECQQNKATDTASWDHVRVRLPDEGGIRQCDIVAHYNRDNASGTEFIVTLFDRTEKYTQEDNSLGFVALAVHELRTPLTVLRGYIEVFEDELSDKLDPELTDFMHKMKSSAQQLTTFVNNILNVARIDENQLALHLSEESWSDIVKSACTDMQLRASVHGINITYDITEGLPGVGVDRTSVTEVLYNLLDNAIKYSGSGKQIHVTCGLNKDGLVETSVRDQGVGIDASVLPNMFEKFYRNHRTKSQIGGSGLGLYLCKSIITAHGGNIWVSSKEGQGSTFTFTLLPFSQLTDEMKTGTNTDIVRNAHGWIKNHSMYRR
jgi:signal transduction histidine kinase